MIDLNRLNQDLIDSKSYFKAVSPGIGKLFTGSIALGYKTTMISQGLVRQIYRRRPAHEILGGFIATKIEGKLVSPISKVVAKTHTNMPNVPRKDFLRKNGMGGRSWYDAPRRETMVIVYHEANRAGPHIDVHLGRLSVVYRVKPDLYSQLKYNSSGELTADSKKLLLAHVRSEIQNGSRVPQNLDHTRSGAKIGWTQGDPDAKTYGSGVSRQVISVSEIDIYKAFKDGPIEFYAPVLNAHRSMYLYRLYDGGGKTAPILIWGNKTSSPPFLHDRLHLKLIDPEALDDTDALADKVNLLTTTAKYDGSSCYLHITPKGTTAWSPRVSVVTGEQIEYTHKIGGLAFVTNKESIVAMGEVLFKEKKKFPWEKTKYLSSAAGSGILNSNLILPADVEAEIRLYRVDSVGRRRTIDLDFWENREIQHEVSRLGPMLEVVELMSHEEAKAKGFEGIVATPTNGSVNEGFKIKWWTDPHDWRIDAVEFRPGDKGSVAGVVWCTSLESGKTFKLGPGQVGDQKLTRAMMASPELYQGTVLKVQSRHGHEGRAAKVVAFHDDKGLGLID